MKKFKIFIFIFIVACMPAFAQRNQQLIAQGDSCVKAYDYFHALDFYQQAQAMNDNNTIKMKLANCYYLRTAYKKCIDLLQKVPEDSLTHDALREMYYAQGAMKKTEEQTYWGKKLLEKFPMDGHILADLIQVFLSQEDNDDAPFLSVLYGERYYKLDSTNVEVNKALGEAYFLAQKYEKCINIYKDIMEMDEASYNAFYYTAGAFEYLNKLDSAAFYFKKAVALNPKLPVGFYRLGVVENQLNHYDEAINYLQTAAKLYEPSKPIMFVIYKNIGEAKLKQQDLKAAYLYWGYALAYVDDKELEQKRINLKKSL